MRQTGVEWIYRLWQEPRRLYRRYAHDLRCFLPTLAHQWWRLAGGREESRGPREKAIGMAQWCSIDAGARLTRRSLEQDAGFWRHVSDRDAHCVIDLSKMQQI